MENTIKPEIATTPSALAELCQHLSEAGSFAFDTEFVGEDTYDPDVCLIQAATDSFCGLIDTLTGLDLSPFWELVANDEIEIIVHAGTEDLAQCWRQIDRPAANVFDLQIAAGFVGLGYPTSLIRLARLTAGVKIRKSQTLTDWRQRPLSPEQIMYAAEDVIHLPAMCRRLRERLVEMGREAWAVEECAAACQSSTQMAKGEQKLRRLRGAKSLRRKELAIADALLVEREKLAREYNRPSRSVLRDHLLVEMARRGWTDVRRIQSLRGLNLKAAAVRRLANAVNEARQLPEAQWPELPTEEDSREEEVLRLLINAVLRDYCDQNRLSHALLANKQDLRALVHTYTRTEQPEVPISLKTGWRRAFAGDLLDGILSGQCAVRVIQDGNGRRMCIE